MATLYVHDGETFHEAPAEVVIQRARALIAQRFRPGAPVMLQPECTRAFLSLNLATLEHEMFAVLFLDVRGCLIEYVELFRGTLNHVTHYPREVVKEALKRNAASVILAHCHPSGSLEPSTLDQIATAKLKDALATVDVQVLDHLIVAGTRVMSMADEGLI